MPSLIDRVTTFGRSPKSQGVIRQAMNRFSGGGDTKKGRRAGTRRGPGARRGAGGTRTRAMRKR
jgi:hypothetical protein